MHHIPHIINYNPGTLIVSIFKILIVCNRSSTVAFASRNRVVTSLGDKKESHLEAAEAIEVSGCKPKRCGLEAAARHFGLSRPATAQTQLRNLSS